MGRGRPRPVEQAVAVLRRAVALGVNHVDTAGFYFSAHAAANQIIRTALAPYPADLVVVTKVGPRRAPDGTWLDWARPEDLREEVERNLTDLGLQRLEVVNYRSNGRDDLVAAVTALAALRDEGLLRHVGVSNVDLAGLETARGVTDVACVQNRHALGYERIDGGDLMAACREHAIAFVPFFTIAGRAREDVAEEQYDAVRAIADVHGVTPAQVRVAWTLALGPHVLAIPGTGDPEHLEQNVAAAALRLTDDDLATLRALALTRKGVNRTPSPFRPGAEYVLVRGHWSARPRRRGRPPARVLRRHPARASRSGWPRRPPTCSGHVPPPTRRGSTCRGLDGVISVDPEARTADVQGMCTYEHLVDATLPHGLIPLVVPQLRTITLGGAVTGLGIESTQLPQRAAARVGGRDGHLHRRRRGRDDQARATDLFETFPNSYGSLGYATRLRIQLEPVPAYVALRHVRFDDASLLGKTIAADHRDPGVRRGPRRRPRRHRLRAGGVLPDPGAVGRSPGGRARRRTGAERLHRAARSTTGRSSERETDLLTVYDYLWRWDTDWFWCSRAFGAQHPVVRRVWPRRWKRVRRLLPDGRARPPLPRRRLARPTHGRPRARAGRPGRRDPRRPAGGVPRLVRRRGRDATGLAVPLDSRSQTVADVPAWRPTRSTSTSASGAPSRSGRRRRTRPVNRAIEAKVHDLGGHKSLYSEAFYDRETFDRALRRRQPGARQEPVRPGGPADHPLRQGGEETMTANKLRIADAFEQLIQGPLPLRFTAYDGSASGPEDAPFGFDLRNERGLALPDDGARRPRSRPCLRHRRPRRDRRPPGRPVRGTQGAAEGPQAAPAVAGRAGQDRLRPRALAPAAADAAAAGDACRAGAGSSRACGTPAPATPRRSTTTTTCRTPSTSASSAPR